MLTWAGESTAVSLCPLEIPGGGLQQGSQQARWSWSERRVPWVTRAEPWGTLGGSGEGLGLGASLWDLGLWRILES